MSAIPAAPSSPAVAPAAAQPAVRGFVIDRSQGGPQRPGSLHTNPRLSQWLSLQRPGVVQVLTGKAELGQGILSALRLLAAEELDVALSRVQIHSATTAQGPDEGVTSGSLSIQDSGGAIRHVCAEVRGLALARAAECSGQPLQTLTVQDGQVLAADGRVLGDYWQLIEPEDLDVEYQGQHAPKPAAARRLLGQRTAPRIDLQDKVFGQPRFIHDLRLPGLRHGRVVRAPAMQVQRQGWPEAWLAQVPDGVQCWADGNFVAVVATQEHQAQAWAERLATVLQWQLPEPLPAQQSLPQFLRSAACQTTVAFEQGATDWVAPSAEASEGLPAGTRHFVADFFKPYLAHGSIGPSCAVARWDGQQLEVWTHSQGIHNLRDDIVLALADRLPALRREDITIHHVEGAGCYGHNGADDVAFDAVLMALHCPGVPVRVLWSREDELSHAPLGAAQSVQLHAQVDVSGQITHWQHALWANGYSSRPGRARTSTLLAASQMHGGQPLPLAINPPLSAGGGADRNAVPGYALPHVRVLNHRLMVMPLRTSAMRALGAYANVFAIESFMDELAEATGQNPLDFRRRHLQDERALAVLDAVVQRSAWWATPPDHDAGIGHGLAWARYKNSGAWCAVLARVQVGEQVRVLNLDLAVDVGMVVDLDGVLNQIEGGALQSMSWALKEEVTFDAAGVTSRDWSSYPVLRFSEVPELCVHVLDRPESPPLGAGEAAQGPVAAALANAVSQALGLRIRSLPLSPDRLLQAVHDAQGG